MVSRWLHLLGLSHPCTDIGLAAVLVAVSFSVCAGFKSLKDSRAAFISNPSLLVFLRSERHRVQIVFGQINARSAVFGCAIIFKSGSSGRPKLPGSDFRLNLVHSSAASGWF
ncbi:unnamed protein product [Brassica rapa subsp. trilocularis]